MLSIVRQFLCYDFPFERAIALIYSYENCSRTARRVVTNCRQDIRFTPRHVSRHPLQEQGTARLLPESPPSCPLGASPGRFTSLPAPRQPSGGARSVAAFPSQDVHRGRYGACSLRAHNINPFLELRFGKDNKSLHPIWSPVTAVARCSGGAATALPVAQTGELNRYICRPIRIYFTAIAELTRNTDE